MSEPAVSLQLDELLDFQHEHRRAADHHLDGIGDVHAGRARHGRGRGRDLLAALADLFDDGHRSLEAVVVHADEQRGVARAQETAGRRKLGHAISIIHERADEPGGVLILDDRDDQFHRSTLLFRLLELHAPYLHYTGKARKDQLFSDRRC